MILYVVAVSLCINLAITLACELVTAIIWGLRSLHSLAAVTLVNISTNPPLSAIMVALWFSPLGHTSVWLLLIFEPIIVLLEGYIYSKALPDFQHRYFFRYC